MQRAPISSVLCLLIVSSDASETHPHYVRGALQQVSESIGQSGGVEDEAYGSATPRVSGDGTKVVFYSDAYFNDATPSGNNDYHIWMADVTAVGANGAFPKTSIYADPTGKDSKGPVVNEDGSAVAFARADDKIFFWSSADTTPRELASSAYDSTGDVAISADGQWVTYEKKSVYDVHLIK